MVKHIVFWKVKPDLSDKAREEAMQRIKTGFESMRGGVPGLLRIEIGFNYARGAEASDIVLYSEFESREALERYQHHPAHLAMMPIVVEARAERRVVDYDTD